MVDAFGRHRADLEGVSGGTAFVEDDTWSREDSCMASLLNSLNAGPIEAVNEFCRAAENPWLVRRQNLKGAQFVGLRSEVRERASRQHRECPKHQNAEAGL
jgi:hypothetical protein